MSYDSIPWLALALALTNTARMTGKARALYLLLTKETADDDEEDCALPRAYAVAVAH